MDYQNVPVETEVIQQTLINILIILPQCVPDLYAYSRNSWMLFSQFSGCWLILSVYILMSFDFPFVRLFGVR